MRTFTYALVVVSALFSTGGVAFQSSADAMQAQVQAAAVQAEEPAAATCKLPQPGGVKQFVLHPKAKTSGSVIQLNNRGYNYRRAIDPPTAMPPQGAVAPGNGAASPRK